MLIYVHGQTISVTMDTISYTKARNEFAGLMEKVCEDHAPVVVTRQNQKPVVMMSLEDYHAFEETAYLMQSPKNAERLNEAVKDLRNDDNFQKHELSE